MYCPFCGHVETKVNDSRLAAEGRQIRRRRECLSCGERFTTFETAELVMPVVVKTDAIRQPYDEAKLRAGMTKALEKRPVASEAIDEAISRITHKVRILGEREVPSRLIGELVMEELRQLDEVAFVRFASVYRHFQDVEAFHEEIQRLRSQQRAGAETKRSAKREPARDANRDQLPLLPDVQQTSDRPTGERAIGDRPVADRPTANRSAADRAAPDRPVSDRPVSDRK